MKISVGVWGVSLGAKLTLSLPFLLPSVVPWFNGIGWSNREIISFSYSTVFTFLGAEHCESKSETF